MKNVEIFDSNFTTNLVENSNKIWIFGDNDLRIGRGGQAIIRGLKNTIGIRTKKSPSTSHSSYYNDEEYEENCKNIFEDLLNIKSKLTEGYIIVFSKNGYGTGLALLQEKAPKTFIFLCECLKSLFEFDNIKGTKFVKLPSFSEIEGGQYLQYIKQNNDILIPINNSLFLDNLLKSGITNYHDAIKSGKKVSITSKLSYSKNQILLLSFYGFKDYIVVKVSEDSFDILDLEIWSNLEGFKYDFLTMDLSGYKQTIFSYIGQLSETGKITFREDFFANDVPISEIEKIDEEKIDVSISEIEKIDEEKIDVSISEIEKIDEEKIDVDSDVLNEILLQLKEINIKLDKLNEKN